MKNVLFILLGCLCLFGQSQELIVDDDVTLKKGIYKNFDEFKFNCPSIPLNDSIIKAVTRKEDFIGGDELTMYEFNMSKKEKKELQIDDAFGFCDGSNVFIRETYSAPCWYFFKKLVNLGLYCYYEGFTLKYSSLPNPGMGVSVSSSSKIIIGKVININKGEVTELSKSALISILENDEELLNRFKDEDKTELSFDKGFLKIKIKKELSLEYIIEYSEKHKTDGIYCRDLTLNEETANVVLLKNEKDTSYNAYFERVYHKLKINPAFTVVTLKQEYFTNGNPQTTGIIAKHNFTNFEPSLCRVGIWVSYYETGVPKKTITYNITGDILGSEVFDERGKLTKSRSKNK